MIRPFAQIRELSLAWGDWCRWLSHPSALALRSCRRSGGPSTAAAPTRLGHSTRLCRERRDHAKRAVGAEAFPQERRLALVVRLRSQRARQPVRQDYSLARKQESRAARLVLVQTGSAICIDPAPAFCPKASTPDRLPSADRLDAPRPRSRPGSRQGRTEVMESARTAVHLRGRATTIPPHCDW